MKKIFLFLITQLIVLTVLAQDKEKIKTKKEIRRERINEVSKQEEEGVIKYKKHFLFGGKLTSDGYGGFVEVGRAQSITRSLLFQLEITERKHQKEEKQQKGFGTSVPFIYGKVNYFYPVKLGLQQQFLLGNKGNKNGIGVSGNVGLGLIAGLLRPYLVNVEKLGENTFIEYNSTDSAAFLNAAGINGGPSIGEGWNKLKVAPGIYLKPALRFDYGKYNEMVNALEVGVSAEYFTQKIPQMVFNKEKQFFFTAFVAIMFGKRK